MNSTGKKLGIVGALLGIGIGLGLGAYWSQPAVSNAQRQPNPQAAFTRYRVVSTEGTNLIVTDYKTQKVYYYAIDKDAEPGADLKLRGAVNLNDVGKKVIKPKLYKLN